MEDIFKILFLLWALFLCAVLLVLYFVLAGMQPSEAEAAAVAEGEGGGEKGLTAEELERLEEGKMAVEGGGECAVCWDKMEETQAARVLPGCCHAFHRSCIDAWLQLHPNCPLCRARLLPPPSP